MHYCAKNACLLTVTCSVLKSCVQQRLMEAGNLAAAHVRGEAKK